MRREGCGHAEGPQHDCDQVDERDAVSARAARQADLTVSPADYPDAADYRRAWDRAYHAEIAFLDADPGDVARVVGKVHN